MVISTTLGRVGLEPRGEYDPAAQYTYLNLVRYGGSSYLVLRPIQGVTPVDGEDYMLLAQAGAPGNPGADGEDGSSIARIERTDGTGAPGTTDTYTITLTDGRTSTFQVYNGKDGQGSGDMTKSVYDKHGRNTDIFDYVDKAMENIPAAENAVTIEGGGTMIPPEGLGPGPYTMIMVNDADGGGDSPSGDGGESSSVPAADVTYDGAASGLEAETVQAAIDELSARDDSNPIGTVISFLGLTAPEGYLVCDGSAYSIADYPALSAFIAAQFGSANHFGGDGTATFAVPDMRNLFLRGYHGAAEEQLSGDIGKRQEATILPTTQCNAGENFGYYTDSRLALPQNADSASSTIGEIKFAKTELRSPGDKQPVTHTVRPVNMAILYCIKAKIRAQLRNVR